MEKIKEALHIALRNLFANTTRSVLSVLGIVIGIAAVIAILSISAGARRDIIQNVNALGVNMYLIFPEFDEQTFRVGEFDMNDVKNIEQLSFVITAFPRLNISREIRTRQRATMATITGIHPSYLKARNQILLQGRNFSPIEIDQRAPVCLINKDSVWELFPEDDPLDKTIYMKNTSWTIVGVFGSSERKTRQHRARKERAIEMLVPITTLMRSEENISISGIEVYIQPDYKGPINSELISIVERSDPKRKGLFSVWDQQEYIQRRLEIDKILTLIITLVGSISLLVGGIGMMNVMLTSVAERTREIGIRRAMGARRKDILVQFVVESSVLSCVGGGLGLIFGTVTARLIPQIFNETFKAPPQVKPVFILVAVGSAALLGIVFGLYPAIKASRLHPADALRTE